MLRHLYKNNKLAYNLHLVTKHNILTPGVFVNTVIFQLINEELSVLLIQREDEPYKERWALPGGPVPLDESTQIAASRIINNKTGIQIKQLGFLEQLYTFDSIKNDPGVPAVSVVYMGLGKSITPKATSHNRNAQFYPLDQIPTLAFDHNNMINYAHQRLKSKLYYTNAIFALLPKMFTLSQLQTVYESVLGDKFDKRNFRKKFLGFNLIKATDEQHMEGAHRPARLYKFNKHELEYLTRSFE